MTAQTFPKITVDFLQRSGTIRSMNATMTAQKFYTIEQLARALSVSRTAVEGRLARNTITPSTTDADGRPLFDEEYVAQLVSERQSRVRE